LIGDIRSLIGASRRADELRENFIMSRKKRDIWLRLQALQIAAELPEDRRQALAVLNCARKIVEEFMPRQHDRQPYQLTGRGPTTVLRLLE
jgi:hypothetical protein